LIGWPGAGGGEEMSPMRPGFVVRFLQTMSDEKHLLCQERRMAAIAKAAVKSAFEPALFCRQSKISFATIWCFAAPL
jgi:hypothetical protein